MTFQRRHNLFFRRLAFLYAFLCVYPLVFKPLHLFGDLEEAAAGRAAARARDAAWECGPGAAASALHVSDPVEPPCAICAALTQITVPAALTPGCQAPTPLFAAVRFVPVRLRFNPCIFVSHAPARAPPAPSLPVA